MFTMDIEIVYIPLQVHTGLCRVYVLHWNTLGREGMVIAAKSADEWKGLLKRGLL